MIATNILPTQLKQLRLSAIRLCYETTSLKAENDHWTYPQYLAALCDQELAVREQHRIDRSLLESKLPLGKSLDTFEFDKLTSINVAQMVSFAETTQWVEQTHNLILFGPSGVGKTHIAAAIGKRLIEKGLRVYFAKTMPLVQKLQCAYGEHKLQQALDRLSKYDLLILDDVDYAKKTDAETSVLFELIADRYETKSILITANQPFDKWDSIFPSSEVAVAAIDRLIHHATIISIDEKSYRKAAYIADKEKRSVN
jgi:DNA replication protein DnaC